MKNRNTPTLKSQPSTKKAEKAKRRRPKRRIKTDTDRNKRSKGQSKSNKKAKRKSSAKMESNTGKAKDEVQRRSSPWEGQRTEERREDRQNNQLTFKKSFGLLPSHEPLLDDSSRSRRMSGDNIRTEMRFGTKRTRWGSPLRDPSTHGSKFYRRSDDYSGLAQPVRSVVDSETRQDFPYTKYAVHQVPEGRSEQPVLAADAAKQPDGSDLPSTDEIKVEVEEVGNGPTTMEFAFGKEESPEDVFRFDVVFESRGTSPVRELQQTEKDEVSLEVASGVVLQALRHSGNKKLANTLQLCLSKPDKFRMADDVRACNALVIQWMKRRAKRKPGMKKIIKRAKRLMDQDKKVLARGSDLIDVVEHYTQSHEIGNANVRLMLNTVKKESKKKDMSDLDLIEQLRQRGVGIDQVRVIERQLRAGDLPSMEGQKKGLKDGASKRQKATAPQERTTNHGEVEVITQTVEEPVARKNYQEVKIITPKV